MAKANITTKRALIDKANSMVVIVAGVAAFVTVFSLVASKNLVSQAGYQNRVLTAKHQAVKQLQADLSATDRLTQEYNQFVNAGKTNAIGGDPNGTGAQDGNNAKIVLDALPSAYDFPALATSLEKLVTSVDGLTINSISGTDDEVTQSANTASSSPQPVPMPFQVSVTGNYQAIQSLIGEFEHSIRPFQVQTISLSGDQDKLTLSLSAQTFYQPAKSLSNKTKVVK